jgi:hypothetical protein
MPTPRAIAESFSNLDFHDDTFIGMKVMPPLQRGDGVSSVVEIQLLHYLEEKTRVIRFSGCANMRVTMDFDVLADNLSPNTSGVDAHTKPDVMSILMKSQAADWDVNYKGSGRSPLTPKLAKLDELIFFRVQFFGGVVDVIAREYLVETIKQTSA